MAKLVGISAGIGFFISLALLVAVAGYASALRSALLECQERQAGLSTERVRCENQLGVLRGQLSNFQEDASRKITSLEARLEAAGAVRRCVGVTSNMAG